MGVHCDTLVKIVKDANEFAEVYSCPRWTPHFGGLDRYPDLIVLRKPLVGQEIY